MNPNPDFGDMLRKLGGIEDSVTSSVISLVPIVVDGKFSELRKSTSITPDGLRDRIEVISRCFDCGCVAARDGGNFGGVCSGHLTELPKQVKKRDVMVGLVGRGRALYLCQRHITICMSCRKRIICVHCCKLIKKVPYCGICSKLIFFGLKKEVVLCSVPIQKTHSLMR